MPVRPSLTLILLIGVLSPAVLPAADAEPTGEIREMARLIAALDTRDRNGYCNVIHGEAYAAYVGKACQMSVQNRIKKSEDCTAERIALEVRNDKQKCLAMPAAEFEKQAARVQEGWRAYIQELADRGIDVDKLIRQEQSKKR